MITVIQFIVSSIVILLGHLVKSVSGFGATLVSMPILANFVNLKILVPLFGLFEVYSGIIVIRKSKHIYSNRMTRLIIAGLLVGTFIGSRLFVNIDTEVLKKYFALLVGLFATYNIFFSKMSLKKIDADWSILAGFLGGLSGALFGLNGPPVVVFYTSQVTDRKMIRNSLFAVFLIDSLWKTILYIENGVITFRLFTLSLLFLPFIFLGLKLGKKIHLKISDNIFKKIVGVILLVSSLVLVSA